MSKSSDISCRVLGLCLYHIGRFDLVLLARRHQRLPVKEHLNHDILLGVETESNLIESWSHTNDARLVLLPQEIVGACVDGLHLPWHLVLVVEVAALPDPSTNTILGAEGLIDKCLLVEGLFEIVFSDAPLHFVLDKSKCVVEVGDVDFLVEKLAKVLDGGFEHKLLGDIFNAQLGVRHVLVHVVVGQLTFHLDCKSIQDLAGGVKLLDRGF